MKNKKKTKSLITLLLPLILFSLLSGCSFDSPQKKIKNVLLISMDTTRSDHLGCYGFSKNTTPKIDAFAKEASLFKNTFSTAPLTMPSHSSILTGTIPPYHGVHTNYNYILGQSNVTLAEILKEKGFTTGAIVSTFVLDSQFGLDQGFDSYNDNFETTLNSIGINERGGGEASRLAMEWIEKKKEERFFLFLHYYDPHKKYAAPEPFFSRFKDDPYSGEIAYTDYSIGKVLKHLKKMGLYDSTLIIITGDHGEMCGEHKEVTHGYYIYNSAIHVPLIIRIPGQKTPRVIDDTVSSIDIVPTVCSLLGIKRLPQHKGMDLSPYLLKDAFSGPKRYVFSESMTATEFGANTLMGITSKKWRYLETTRPELYDRLNNPQETENLVEKRPRVAEHMKGILKQLVEDQLRQDTSDSKADLDEDAIKRLESLGYISGSSSENLIKFDREKEDPKDCFPFFKECAAVNSLVVSKKFDKALASGMELVKKWPDRFKAHNILASIALKQEDYETAVQHYLISIRLNPNQHNERNTLGKALIALKRYDQAILQLKESLRLSPKIAGTHFLLGQALALAGKKEEALESLKKALRIRPNFCACYIEMARITADHEIEKACGYLKKAIEIRPTDAKAHLNLGILYRKQNRFNDAVLQYLKALKSDPSYSNIYTNLGETLALKGYYSKAIEYYDRALKIDKKNEAAVRGKKTASKRKKWKDDLADRFREAIQKSPADSNLHSKFGNLIASESPLEALAHYRKALEIDPENKNAARSMAWLLATHPDSHLRDSVKAVKLAEKACPQGTCSDPVSLDILAAAYASAERFDKAVETASKALKLAASASKQTKSAEIRERLQRYREKRPYHDGFIFIPAEYEKIPE